MSDYDDANLALAGRRQAFEDGWKAGYAAAHKELSGQEATAIPDPQYPPQYEEFDPGKLSLQPEPETLHPPDFSDQDLT